MDLKSLGLSFSLASFLFIASSSGDPACKAEGQTFPDSNSCTHYFSCRKGNLVREFCGIFKKYNEKTGKCSIWWKTDCSEAECNIGQGKAVLSDCSSYYPCDPSARKWSKVKAACEKGQGFDPEKSKCVEKFDCSKTPVCEDGERKVRTDSNSDCRGYSECSGGKWMEKSCFIGFGYSTAEKKCRFMQECPYCQKGDRMPVSSDCKAYMDCQDGRWVEGKCGFLSRLEGTSLDCRFFFFVDCEEGKCKEGSTMGMREVNKNGGGRQGEDSFYPDRYLKCIGGEWTNERCHWPQKRFNPETGNCEMSWGSDETKPEEENPSSKKVKRDVSKKPSVIEGEPCQGDWKKAYKGDCSKYYQCIQKVVQLKSCSVMMRFDREKLDCEFGWYVKCDEEIKPSGDDSKEDGKKKNKCKENERRGIRGICDQYKTCRKGKWVLETCLLEKEFDMETTTCLPKGQAKCSRSSWEPSFLFKVCNDGDKRAVDFRCDGYQICSDGEWALTACDDGQRFDSKSLQCLPYSEAQCFVPDCQKGEKKSLGTNCRDYGECVDGAWRKNSCYWPRKFDSEKKSCEWPWSHVQCGGKEVKKREVGGEVSLKKGEEEDKSTSTVLPPGTTTVKPPGTTTVKPPGTTTAQPDNKCPKGLVYPIKGTCKGYNECNPSDGKVTAKYCSNCKNFDDQSSKCVWVWKKICTDGNDPTVRPTVTPPSDKCQEGDKRKKPGEDGVNCRGYQECDSNGDWVDKKCWWPWEYDKELKVCTFWKGKC